MGVDSEHAAEAGLLGSRAGHGDDGALVSAGFIVAVDRVAQKDAVKNLKALGVAGAHAENNKVLCVVAKIDDFDFLSVHLKAHEVFGLGKKRSLGGTVGVKLVETNLCALAPFKEVDFSVSLDGEIELVALEILAEKLGKLFLCLF